LHTSRGARGGVTLARDPQDITLLEVVEAIDGPIQLNECVGGEGTCTFDDNCPIKPVWCNAQEELVQRLKNTNFGDLLQPA
jgi:Rrf2 family protein